MSANPAERVQFFVDWDEERLIGRREDGREQSMAEVIRELHPDYTELVLDLTAASATLLVCGGLFAKTVAKRVVGLFT